VPAGRGSMHRPIDSVEVRAWDQLVGAVALDPKLGFYAFEYAPAFIRTGIELAPLAMPLAAAHRGPFIFTGLSEPTYKRLPAMLADSLPDDFGNHLINAWMANQGLAAADITALDRLAYMGKRAMGALEFRPVRGPGPGRAAAIVLSELIESLRRPAAAAATALKQLLSVGTSAGGARAKAVIAWNPRTHEIRAGQFDVDPGFEHWILKFDGIGTDTELGEPQGHGRIEYAYHLMAVQAGIHMSPCRLLEQDGRAHFMTKRFDRDGNHKLHTQTLCGLAQLDYKARGAHDYSQLFSAMRRLQMPAAAFEQAFRRVAFNVMASNCDDHSKNISFILNAPDQWALAPAYDLIYAYNPKGAWTYQHLIAVNGKYNDIGRADLLLLADRFQIGAASKLLAQVREAVAAWPDFAARASLSASAVERIRAHQLLL